MWCDLLINIISDLLFAILAFVFWYCVFLMNKQRKLHKFFGIEKNKKITIYTSRLIVKEYGSLGNDGREYSFQGTAIPNEESKAANHLRTLFNYFLPSQIGKSGFLSKLLISDVDVRVYPSPVFEDMIDQSTSIISLGLPGYNLISRFIEDSLNPSAKLDYIPIETISDNMDEINIGNGLLSNLGGTANFVFNPAASGSAGRGNFAKPSTFIPAETSACLTRQTGEIKEQPVIKTSNGRIYPDTTMGFVQKFFDSQNNRTIFYVAGLSENSTAGSAYYLANHWEDLKKSYSFDTPFCVLLRVSRTDYTLSEVIP